MKSPELLEFCVKNLGTRLDLALVAEGVGSRGFVQKLISEGHVLVEGEPVLKASYKLAPGAKVKVTIPPEEPVVLIPQKLPLNVVYEDEALLVVNKPRGQVVHPACGHSKGTLVNALAASYQLSSIGLPLRPGIVHRLDKDTSGLLVVAKTDAAHLALVTALKKREVERHYLALVHGAVTTKRGLISVPLARDPRNRKKFAVSATGKEAITHFQLLERLGNYSLLGLELETGRTHQIRVSLAHLGHPVVGDPLYGPKKPHFRNLITGQALHAQKLAFVHPLSGEKFEFSAPIPLDFNAVLTSLGGGKVEV